MIIHDLTSSSRKIKLQPLVTVRCDLPEIVYTTNMEVQRGVKKGRKRNSILKNAKKYGKKGKFGRGSHLDEDIYQYFVRVLELVETNKFETEEEKGR